ncbi:MAG: ribonuclease D [Pseudomonadota bacterium]
MPIIAQREPLRTLTDGLAASPVLGLDTEFLRERSYRPQLCLIQIASAEAQACIDPLALEDLNPLAARLADERQTKILHAAGQDLEVLHQQLGILPTPLFDTQIAAAMCGLGEQMGYAALVERLFGIPLDKTHSRTDWSRRPLSEEQVRYALDDVRYLPEAHARLCDRLRTLGRLDWLEEDCAAQLDPARWTPQPLEAWRRVKGWQRLPSPAFPRLRQLAAWRETRAARLDRPRRWVLDDDALLALSQRPPQNLHALLHGNAIPPALKGCADEIMHAIEAARQDDTRAPVWTPMSGEVRGRFERLAETLDHLAGQLELPAGLLINRGELERLARGQSSLDGLRGWRAEVLAKPLAASL